MLIPCLSNAKDKGGRTALVEYGNDGNYIATHWLPTKEDARGASGAEFADGYGYDARVLPRKNALLTSSFTGWNNYTMDFGKMTADPEAMKHFGNTMVMWDFHARQPKKVFQVPGAPLEIRWAWGDKHNYAFTATALTSKLWLVYADDRGEWQAKEVAPISDVKGGVLPVDISLSADDKTLFVDCFGDGKCRVFDVSDPQKPKQIYEKQIGKQVNMVSQSWDGKRLYFTSSLLARWDKQGADNEQFLRALRLGRQRTKAERSISISPRSSWAARITCSLARRKLARTAPPSRVNSLGEAWCDLSLRGTTLRARPSMSGRNCAPSLPWGLAKLRSPYSIVAFIILPSR